VVELASLVDISPPSPGPYLDTAYFPNIMIAQAMYYRTSSPSQTIQAQAGQVGYTWVIDFRVANSRNASNNVEWYIRLVHGDF